MVKGKKLVFLVTELGYFCSHRLALALEAKRTGYEVSIITDCSQRHLLSSHEQHLTEFTLYPIPFHRSSLNPLKALMTGVRIWRLYRKICPDIVHQVALKPVIYGTLCARFQKKNPLVINALGGMGYLFTHKSFKTFIIKIILRFAFWGLLGHKNCYLILQNADDVKLMARYASYEKICLIKGAGVNLKIFSPTPEAPSPPVIAVMASRLLWSKGVGEAVEAAKILKKQGIPVQIQIAGGADPQNPKSVPLKVIDAWKKQGDVIFLGERPDIAAVYGQAHIALLPSYREGLPKSLAEAAACGKPIITTDATGCRDVVDVGVNGLLVPPGNAPALARALKTLAASPEMRLAMGQASRKKAEREFDENLIIRQTLALYQKDAS